MTADIAIERGASDDAEQLADFARQVFVAAYGARNTPQHVTEYVENAFSLSEVRRHLARDDIVHLLARSRETQALVGYTKLRLGSPATCVDDPQAGQIERIYVAPSAQNQGLGKKLLDATLDVAAARDARQVWLAVWEENHAAQRFYRRQGFRPAGRAHFELGPECQSDMVMVRDLTRMRADAD